MNSATSSKSEIVNDTTENPEDKSVKDKVLSFENAAEEQKGESSKESEKNESVLDILKEIRSKCDINTEQISVICRKAEIKEHTDKTLLELTTSLVDTVNDLKTKSHNTDLEIKKFNEKAIENSSKINQLMEKLNSVPTVRNIETMIDERIQSALVQLRNQNPPVVEVIDANVFEEPIESDNTEDLNTEEPEPNSTNQNAAEEVNSTENTADSIVLDNFAPRKGKKYRNREAEKLDKFTKSRSQFGLTLTREMVAPHFGEDISSWSNS